MCGNRRTARWSLLLMANGSKDRVRSSGSSAKENRNRCVAVELWGSIIIKLCPLPAKMRTQKRGTMLSFLKADFFEVDVESEQHSPGGHHIHSHTVRQCSTTLVCNSQWPLTQRVQPLPTFSFVRFGSRQVLVTKSHKPSMAKPKTHHPTVGQHSRVSFYLLEKLF